MTGLAHVCAESNMADIFEQVVISVVRTANKMKSQRFSLSWLLAENLIAWVISNIIGFEGRDSNFESGLFSAVTTGTAVREHAFPQLHYLSQ